MQREIKYRGQRIDTKEWVYGYYVSDAIGKNLIITYFSYYITACTDCGMPSIDYFEVIPESVGEYTGLRDKNGKEIYEEDIVTEGVFNYIIKWLDFGFWKVQVGEKDIYRTMLYGIENYTKVGNIYENPELLQEVE